jgi:hypothetical protein
MSMGNPARNNRPKASLLLCAAIATIVATLRCENAGADLLADAKTVRPGLAAKYEAAYAHVEMRTVQTISNDSGVSRWVETCEYLRNGVHLRKTAKTSETDRKDIPPGRVGVIAVGPGYRWQANKPEPNAPFAMVNFKPPDQQQLFVAERTSCAPLFAYAFLDSICVDDVLTEKKWGRPVSAALATLDGRRLIKVIADVKAKGGETVKWDLYFLPDNWALAGATERLPGVTLEYRMTYENADPLRLKTFQRWTVIEDEPQHKTQQLNVDVLSIVSRDVPESEFRLTALGLEEPVIPGSKPRWTKYLWINALVFASLGLWFAFLSAQRRRRSNAAAQSAAEGANVGTR